MLRVTGLRKSYSRGGQPVVAARDVSFEVPDGAFFTLLGPSGCGKTTTLRSVAGLEKPEAGEIQIGNRLVFSGMQRVMVPPHRRRVSMVFQSYAIWPHMSVAQNVAYPLETRGHTRTQIRERVAEVLRLVDLPGLEDRPATDLSGGQQQRVAVARAIIAEADALLLDEPLSNVDTRLRAQMRDDLRALQQRLRVTTLYVTHDQEEALGLSDLVAVMDAGYIVEVGTPSDLYLRPRRKFTATFIGQTNLLSGRVVRTNGASAQAETSLGPLAFRAESAPTGARVDVCVRPEDLEIVDGEEPVADGDLVVSGTVTRATFLGSFVDCGVQVGEHMLQLRVHPRQMPRSGEVVRVRIPAACCYAVAE